MPPAMIAAHEHRHRRDALTGNKWDHNRNKREACPLDDWQPGTNRADADRLDQGGDPGKKHRHLNHVD